MENIELYRFTKSHEWIRVDDGIATVGITDHAQAELGDVALVLMPEVGRMLQSGEKFGEVESIKAVSDLYCPVSGAVCAVNEILVEQPELVNDDPHGTGWMIKVTLTAAEEIQSLLTAAEYDAFLQES